MTPNAALNLAQHVGQWLTTEDSRAFFKKSKRNAGIAIGDFLGLGEQDRSTKPAILQARAGIVSTAMHHPVSIHLFMLWGLLGVVWTAAVEHPKRSEDREQALKKIFHGDEYEEFDKQLAEEEDTGEIRVLKIHHRTIRGLQMLDLKSVPNKLRKTGTKSHWCLQVGDYYYELRHPGSLTNKKTQDIRSLSEDEELFNSSPNGEKSKGIWFLITRNKPLRKGWQVLYDSETSHSHRRIRARAKRMYEQRFTDLDDKSQYDFWVNNCQTFATFLAIAITEPKERRAIVNQTLTSKSSFWLSAVGSVFASVYFYWCKKLIEEVKPHVEKRATKNVAGASWLNDKLSYLDQRWDYYYLHPQVMLQRQQFLEQAIGPEKAREVKRLTSGGIKRMKEIEAKKHEWKHRTQDKYRRWRSSDSLQMVQDTKAAENEDTEQECSTIAEEKMEERIEKRKETNTPCTEDVADLIEPQPRDPVSKNKVEGTSNIVEANTSTPEEPKHFNPLLAKKHQIYAKKQEMKGHFRNKYRQWKSADELAKTPQADTQSATVEQAGSEDSVKEVTQGVDAVKGLTLVDKLDSNENARDDIEARLRTDDQENVDRDAMDMATAEMMARVVLEESDAESLVTVSSIDSSRELSRSSSMASEEIPSPGPVIGLPERRKV